MEQLHLQQSLVNLTGQQFYALDNLLTSTVSIINHRLLSETRATRYCPPLITGMTTQRSVTNSVMALGRISSSRGYNRSVVEN